MFKSWKFRLFETRFERCKAFYVAFRDYPLTRDQFRKKWLLERTRRLYLKESLGIFRETPFRKESPEDDEMYRKWTQQKKMEWERIIKSKYSRVTK